MTEKLLRIVTCVIVAGLLVLPSMAISKPSVSSSNYTQKTPPPPQQAETSTQSNAYMGYSGNEALDHQGNVPPPISPGAVPEPMTLILVGLGVAGAGVVTRLRKKPE